MRPRIAPDEAQKLWNDCHNFHRSGFPVLKPNPYFGSDLKTETFIRRLTYTDAELNVNHDNVQKAIAVQGPDLLDTRVWWDKNSICIN